MKNYIIFFLLTSLIFSCKDGQKNDEPQTERPNIVFIMSDDHAEQAISAYGHPISKLAPTPNIDRIADQGVIFNNNFCTNSICGPSRAVILTGKFSHINGFRMNGERFDGNQVTLPKILKKAGYTTAIIGKWHLYGYPQGFDYWDILDDQGKYYNPDFISNGDTTQVMGYATDIITDKSLAWLEKNKSEDKPFFLMVHHKAPHRNWMPAPRHYNMFDSVQFPLPDSYFSLHENQPGAKQQQQTIYVDMYEGHDLKLTRKKGSPELAHNPWKDDFERMTPEQRAAWDAAYQPKNDAFHEANLSGKELAEYKGQRYLEEYLSTVASVDDGVGRILDYLEKNNLTENTLIVYTSDQGFYLGEKGYFDKRYIYEESLAMPLLMQYPKMIKKGSKINALTQNVDFPETFLDLAGVEIPEDMQGKSFAPLFKGEIKDDDFRDAVYYHYYDFPAFHMVAKQYGIRTKRYKIVHFYDDLDAWEMYDLEEDPQEENNIYGKPEYADVQQELMVKLDSLQTLYKVTDKEFERAPEEKVKRAYENFDRLRGHDETVTKYYPGKD